MSLISKILSAIVAMLLIYTVTYWVSGNWESSLVIAIAMGILSAVRIVGAFRKSDNASVTSSAAWYYFGTMIVAWMVFLVVNWWVHR